MTPQNLFNQYIDTDSLSDADERQLITAAQNGNQEAYADLMLKFGPLLKRYASQAPKHIEREDVQGALMLGFVEAVTDFDFETHSTLAATLPNFLRRALSEMGISASSFTIPSRSLSRWLAITRKADGNIYLGINLAPEYGMSRETYLSIHSALRSTNSLDALMQAGEFVTRTIHVSTDQPVGETDNDIAGMVFELHDDENDLTDREAFVLRLAYGFLTYGDAMTDDSVAERVGLSRPSVQRIRKAALEKARRRLGLDA